ncbi:hypothetical protein T5B8_16364 [Salinisphaera sp. T5B8]
MIKTPRYRGQFNYTGAHERNTIAFDAADGLPVLLADHIYEPDLPFHLGPGLTVDGETLCDIARFEVAAMRTAVVDGRTRCWRITVTLHAGPAERMTGMLPSHDHLHEALYDGEATRERVEKALETAVSHCRLHRHWRHDEFTSEVRLSAGA